MPSPRRARLHHRASLLARPVTTLDLDARAWVLGAHRIKGEPLLLGRSQPALIPGLVCVAHANAQSPQKAAGDGWETLRPQAGLHHRRKWPNTTARVPLPVRGPQPPHRCWSAHASRAILAGIGASLASHTSKAAQWRSRTTHSRLNLSCRSHRPPLTRRRPGGLRARRDRRCERHPRLRPTGTIGVHTRASLDAPPFGRALPPSRNQVLRRARADRTSSATAWN
jgi:hypothetical protein